MYLLLETINIGCDEGLEQYIALVNLPKIDANTILDGYAALDAVDKPLVRWAVEELVLKWLGEIYLYDVNDTEFDDPLVCLADKVPVLSASTSPDTLTVNGKQYRAEKATDTRIVLTNDHVCFRANLAAGRIVETVNIRWNRMRQLAMLSETDDDATVVEMPAAVTASKPNSEPAPSLQDGDVSPAEFAASWGCDPAYDTPPRHRGDGYLFYNYASEHQPKDADYLTRLIGAVDRTILDVQQAGRRTYTAQEAAFQVAELEYFKELLKDQLNELADVSGTTDAS